MIRKNGARFSEKIMLHPSQRATADAVAKHCAPPAGLDRQRIDRWLWHARLVRTREAAAQLAGSGLVRINGMRIDAPSRFVRAGDVVTVALDHTVRVLRVRAFAERRGPAGTGSMLYEELS